MKQVYAPANSAEAHMLAHMLDQNEIVAHIHGEALQGGVGELPAGGLLQLLVADEDYERARALIAEWERTNVSSPDKATSDKPRVPIWMGLIVFVMGIGGGWVLRTAASNNMIPVDAAEWSQDQNGDGRTDVTNYARVGATYAYKSEVDRNFDGDVDLTYNLDANGSTVSSTADDDFDGFAESRTVYRDGNSLRTSIDTDRDGDTDRTLHYVYGIFVREEINAPGSNRIARVDYYGAHWMNRSESDLDGDGFLETAQTYDALGAVTGTETLTR